MDIFKEEGIIPIGLLFKDGEWLEEYEIDENIGAKKKGYLLSKEYRQAPLRAAGIFFNKIFTDKIIFEVPSKFYEVDNKLVSSVKIDFGDGKGFKDLLPNERYPIEYNGNGEKSIAIKIVTDDTELIFYSKLTVEYFEFEAPDFVFDIGNVTDVGLSETNSRIETLSGGRAVLYNGCDRLFDKPVIIVEGFDPLNQRNIYPDEAINRPFSQTIRGPYRQNIERTFRNNGYDVIYLNFNNGGADIRQNAQVLEQLVIDVKARKIGSHGISIIGESMGGLVARYCLKSMENRSIVHNVNKFISFDSPHLGANVPVGYQTMVDDLDDVDILNLFNIAQSSINEGLTYLNSTAARQMLLMYKGANPHPDFTSLQNEFQQMGFPSQNNIKNIAIVNASITGASQDPIAYFIPGNIILDVNAFTGALNAVLRIRTNGLNTSTKVSSIWVLTGPVPTTVKDRTFSFNAFNYDVSAGGFQTNMGLGNIEVDTKFEWFNKIATWFVGEVVETFGRDYFSFVPLFSSVASTAPRNNQSDLNRPVSQIKTNNWTPFQAIYGGVENSNHAWVPPIQDSWISLLTSEFGISYYTSTCQTSPGTMPPPPIPYFNTTYWYKCPDERRTFTINGFPAISNLYYHVWEITGPNGYFTTVHGDQLSVHYLPPGAYTITLYRTYSGGVYSNITTLHSRVFTVFPASDPVYCNGGGGGGPIPRLLETDQEEEESVHKPERIEEESIKFWPNPTSGKLHLAFNLNETGMLQVSVYPASSSYSEGTVLTDSWRPAGKFGETYNLQHLKKGLYLIRIQTGSQIVTKRLIVN